MVAAYQVGFPLSKRGLRAQLWVAWGFPFPASSITRPIGLQAAPSLASAESRLAPGSARLGFTPSKPQLHFPISGFFALIWSDSG